jgi:hypothetical protein
MARTSDDLFDAYRNLFLAFESLLSDIRPRRRVTQAQNAWWHSLTWWHRLKGSQSIGDARWESEKAWFMDALNAANGLVPIASLTPPQIMNDANRNHAKWIYKSIYQTQRSGLMHAKRGQNYLLPHDATDRAELIESLGRLSDYIKNLIDRHLHVQSPSGSMTHHAIAMMAQNVLPQFPLVITDDEGPVHQETENVISPNATVVQLRSSTPRVDPGDPWHWRMLAHCDAADVVALTAIRRVGHTRSDGSGTSEALSELVGPLVLGSTVVRLGHRGNSRRDPSEPSGKAGRWGDRPDRSHPVGRRPASRIEVVISSCSRQLR